MIGIIHPLRFLGRIAFHLGKTIYSARGIVREGLLRPEQKCDQRRTHQLSRKTWTRKAESSHDFSAGIFSCPQLNGDSWNTIYPH